MLVEMIKHPNSMKAFLEEKGYKPEDLKHLTLLEIQARFLMEIERKVKNTDNPLDTILRRVYDNHY